MKGSSVQVEGGLPASAIADDAGGIGTNIFERGRVARPSQRGTVRAFALAKTIIRTQHFIAGHGAINSVFPCSHNGVM